MFRFCLIVLLIGFSFDANADVVGRVQVIDADTFDVNGVRVRLHGIDAPEQKQQCTTEQGAQWACGAWVTARVGALFDGRTAYCRQVDIDRYDRVVARCQIAGRDVGRVLVREGLAFAYRKYSMAYDLDEKAAAIQDKGLHSSRVQSPSQYRKTRAKGRIPPDPTCRIKGNISASGRIFHSPGQLDYEQTGINLAKGERWFCSADQARAAGWRPAKR